MLVIPAIDIRRGKCVRLLQGDPDRETVYGDDPVAVARRFEEEGARLIHVVDLDGAFCGTPVNHHIIAAIARAVSIPIEVGGGIRTESAVAVYEELGIRRIIVGTALLDESFRGCIERHRDILIGGVDARDGIAATHGWKKVSGRMAVDVIRDMAGRGIKEFVYTDIATDGMLSGPNVDAIRHLLSNIKGIDLIASGGISSMQDLELLASLNLSGLKGCITGKAIYDGRIELREAAARFR